jgi:hypothetical protein
MLYVIRKFQVNQLVLKLNDTYQILVYTKGVNLMDKTQLYKEKQRNFIGGCSVRTV